jgi:hypothetical protein
MKRRDIGPHAVAGNLDRFASGEPLENVVLQT